MNAKSQIETELEVLGRIVTMLLSLACLADRASRASCPVRAFVLWLLRRAEAVVGEWVAVPGHPGRVTLRVGSDPRDALALAASLRALAHAVEDLAADYLRLGRWWRCDKADATGRRAIARDRSVAPRFQLSSFPLPSRINLAASTYDTS